MKLSDVFQEQFLMCEKAYNDHIMLNRISIDSLSAHLFYAALCLKQTTFEEFAIWCQLNDVAFIYDEKFVNSLIEAVFSLLKKSSSYLPDSELFLYIEKMKLLRDFIEKLNSH